MKLTHDVQKLRKTLLNMNQKEFAKYCNVGLPTIKNLEKHNIYPKYSKMAQIANAFGKTVEEVFHLKGNFSKLAELQNIELDNILSVYTSYYDSDVITSKIINGNNFDDCLAISRTKPSHYKGKSLKILAPSQEILTTWKIYGNEEMYIKKYYEQLNNIPEEKWENILELIDNKILLCYEKPGVFCHRHLLIKYMKIKYGTKIKFTFKELE